MCTNNSESATVELVHWRQQLLVVGELGLAGWDSHQWDSVPLPPTEIATSGTRSTPSSSRPPPFIPPTIFQLVSSMKNSNNPIRFFQRLKKTTMAWLPGLEFLRWDQICKISRRHYTKIIKSKMSSVNKVLVSLLQLAVIAFARECVLDSDCEQSQQFGRIQAIQVDFFLFVCFVANILWFAKKQS